MAVFLFACLLLTLPGTVELLLLTIGACLPAKPLRKKQKQLKTAVVIPAHDEEKTLGLTLESLKHCRKRGDIIVVAHNCSDSTASIAQKFGARVLTLNAKDKTGKAHALDFAFRHLAEEDYDLFAVVDADTVVAANFIEAINEAAAAGAQAIQVPYHVANAGESVLTRIANISFMACNHLRPRGRSRLGLSAGILGNGFALSSSLVKMIPFSQADSLVEDCAYHLEILRRGYRVDFCEKTWVRALMPATKEGLTIQRTRWEGGRFQLLSDQLPMILQDLWHCQYQLVEPLLDLLLPPLSYYLLLVVASCFFSLWYGLAAMALIAWHLVFAIIVGKGGSRDFLALFFIPYYLVIKLSVALKIPKMLGKGASWQRTPRDQ